MTMREKIARRKLGLLQLASELSNVSKACRIMGFISLWQIPNYIALGHGVPPDYDLAIYEGGTPFLSLTQEITSVQNKF